jgi:hypothetical protein
VKQSYNQKGDDYGLPSTHTRNSSSPAGCISSGWYWLPLLVEYSFDPARLYSWLGACSMDHRRKEVTPYRLSVAVNGEKLAEREMMLQR